MNTPRNEIKPLFCLDATLDKHNNTINGKEFIARSTSKEKIEEFENKREELQETIKKSQLPCALQILQVASGFICVMILLISLRTGLDIAWKNAPALLIAAPICGVICIALLIASKVKEKKLQKNGEAQSKVEELRGEESSINEELDIPADAVEIDVLAFRYKTRNGKIRITTPAFAIAECNNVSVKMYATVDEIHVADISDVYSFKKYEVRAIIPVNKTITMSSWNKSEDPREGSYKQYKMKVNGMGSIFVKPYYILEIRRGVQSYGIYFPCYELETIQRLTGLRVAEDEQ